MDIDKLLEHELTITISVWLLLSAIVFVARFLMNRKSNEEIIAVPSSEKDDDNAKISDVYRISGRIMEKHRETCHEFLEERDKRISSELENLKGDSKKIKVDLEALNKKHDADAKKSDKVREKILSGLDRIEGKIDNGENQ